MGNIWLIRHAESTSNAGLPTDHPVTIPLTEKGQDQAARLVNICTYAPDLIVTSPYVRTLHTATPVLNKFSGTAHDVWNIQEFTYLSTAKYKGTTNDDRKPYVDTYWTNNDPDFRDSDDAETYAEFTSRVSNTINKLSHIANDTPASVVYVFSHGIFMQQLRLMLTHSHDDPAFYMPRFRDHHKANPIKNTAIIKLAPAQDSLRITDFVQGE